MKKAIKSLTLLFFSALITTFYSCKKDEIPTLSTNNVSLITETTAKTGGYVTSNGGADVIARGVCWNTEHDPTIADNSTTDGTGSGTFSSYITSLTPNTTFYVRAYATSSEGTAYGNEVTFTTPLTYYPGAARLEAVSFSIGTKVYIGLGLDIKYDIYGDGEASYYKDFWEWDQATDLWTRKADYPGNPEGSNASFSIGTKGYIGSSTNSGNFNVIWEYDPAIDAWTQKASLPKTAKRFYNDVGFSIGNKGYIGGAGISDSTRDGEYYYYKYKNLLWEWDQTTNVWTKKADLPGEARWNAVGFSIGNKGYLGTGYAAEDNNVNYLKDFWEWDQATDVWSRKADFGGTARRYAVGFSIGNKGYLGTGSDSRTQYKDFWEWNQANNIWTKKADFKGNVRNQAVGFSIGNKGFIGSGIGIGFSNVYESLRDFWEYDPTIR
jgi:N-acetylneuraminic acid mutarotase